MRTLRKMSRQNRTLKDTMLEALRANMGIVSKAAEAAGIARSTHYLWLQEDEEYKQAVEDISEYVIDFAESALYRLIKEKNPQATLFFLKTRGKARGYVERQEIEVTEKKPLSWIAKDGEE